MIAKKFSWFLGTAAMLAFCLPHSHGQYLKIKIPRRSELTPVQRLNREGVEEIRKQRYEKAEELFYKAYLYDPSDPFTLNNIGYIAELQGQFERAQRFYKLAAEQGTNASIDISNEKQLDGKKMKAALESLQDLPMRLNRMNFDAMTLLSQNRPTEAMNLLQAARRMDQNNAFTLNNLGVASEASGDYDLALRYYAAAAAARSNEAAVVTTTGAYRGQPVSQMAAGNQQRLEQRMEDLKTDPARAALLASRGVAAVNRNDWETARKDFVEAYRLDPYSAFSLNNAGYVAEHDGDIETAQFFYAKAEQADDAHARVGTATRPGAEGNPLATIADNNSQDMQEKLDLEREIRRRQTGPIELHRRDGTPVKATPPAQPASPDGSSPDTTTPQQPQ
ncbi:MAG TPA: tetratricopeptide repeat protein [Acidobacteriaceae bacterium]|nr:tetratricopeptide repeat protein [Acidobacteriaceae bacterium]